MVSIRNVQYVVHRLESMIDEEKVRQFGEHKKSLKEKEQESQDKKLKNRPASSAPSQAPKPVTSPLPPITSAPRPVISTVRVTLPVEQSEDAFARNLDDIRPFVRAFWKEHRRFPTTDEALDWIKANSRYSGEWEDGERKRAKRVGQILAFTERTFDPQNLSQGDHQSVALKVGRFSWWVRQRIGSVMTGQIANLREFDPVAMTAPDHDSLRPGQVCRDVSGGGGFLPSARSAGQQGGPDQPVQKAVGDGRGWGCLEPAVFPDSPGSAGSHGGDSDFRPQTSQRESMALGSRRDLPFGRLPARAAETQEAKPITGRRGRELSGSGGRYKCCKELQVT